MRKARLPDVMTPEQRSRCMSHIKGKNTRPELELRRSLWKRGWRYRVKTRLVGHPDLVFSTHRLVVFVDGCFWHGCPRHGVFPRSNRQFWKKKLSANAARDRAITVQLRKTGWKVLRFWEHDVDDHLQRVVSATERQLARRRKIIRRNVLSSKRR